MKILGMPRMAFLGIPLVGLLGLWPAQAQQIHRNTFETSKTAWVKGGGDAPFDEVSHTITDQVQHDGQRSEYINLQVKPGGNIIYYQYSIGKAPIGEETNASLWLKANRPGPQFMARIVLPNERDPNNLDNRLTTFIRGDAYRNAGRWQRLEISRMVQLAQQQQQLMQAQLKRPLNFTDAYIDALMVNVYGGPGPTEVWIDDLEVGPLAADVVKEMPPLVAGNSVTKPTAITRPSSNNMVVEFNGSQILVAGRRIFFHGIRQTDTPLRSLRDAGFNTVFLDSNASPALIKEAADLGLWVVPQLNVLADDTRLNGTDGITKELSRFIDNDAILFWHLSSTLSFEQTTLMTRAAKVVRDTDAGRPVTADVWDGLKPYSRILNLVGVYRWPLMTTLEMPRYREWLEQRRRLANPGTFTWTWIQTQIPDWFTNLLYDRSGTAAFTEPVGPQPEQIRLLTYNALAAGCKGLGFWSDRFLADSHQGRDRLLCCALLNQELEMLEPFLVGVEESQWVDTSSPDVKAAVLRSAKGIVVLPVWQGKGAQFVPGQAAVSKLSLVVPQVSQSNQAWEVTPADVRGLRCERVAGGTKITIPEFGLTSAIVFTADNDVVIRFQTLVRNRRQTAAQYTYDMALYELEKVLKVEENLESQGHSLPDAQHLLADAKSRLKTARERWDNRDFAEAYREGERALRPIRILMRAQWDQAIKGLDTPVASPYAVTFYTLPRHWQFMDEVKRSGVMSNVLPGGDFEIIPERTQDSWKVEEKTIDDVEFQAQRVTQFNAPIIPKAGANSKDAKTAAKAETIEMPHEGKQCALLQIKAKKAPAPPALERTQLALTSPTVTLQPGTLVQISAWIRITEAIKASQDGALFYDSVGGEPLAIRLTDPMPWKKITLYRRVPASGNISVILALTGLGAVYFDDVRIEPLAPAGNNGTVQVGGTSKR